MMSTDAELTDAQLLIQTKKGSLTAYEILVKRYEDRLMAFVYKTLLDSDSAKDVVQETFIRIFKHIDTFDTERAFTPWMYKIARNLSLDIIRKGRHTAVLEWDVEDSHESILSRIIKHEQVTLLWNAIRALPDMYKQPLIGYYFADLSIKDIAFTMNMSENTIKTRIRRAKNYLKTELGRKGYG